MRQQLQLPQYTAGATHDSIAPTPAVRQLVRNGVAPDLQDHIIQPVAARAHVHDFSHTGSSGLVGADHVTGSNRTLVAAVGGALGRGECAG